MKKNKTKNLIKRIAVIAMILSLTFTANVWAVTYFFLDREGYLHNTEEYSFEDYVNAYQNDDLIFQGPWITKGFLYERVFISDPNNIKKLVKKYGGVTIADWSHYYTIIGWKKACVKFDKRGTGWELGDWKEADESESGAQIEDCWIITDGSRRSCFYVPISFFLSFKDEEGTMYHKFHTFYTLDISDQDPFEGKGKIVHCNPYEGINKDEQEQYTNNSTHRWKIIGGYWAGSRGISDLDCNNIHYTGSELTKMYKDYLGRNTNNSFITPRRLITDICQTNPEPYQIIGYVYFDKDIYVDVGETVYLPGYFNICVEEMTDSTGSFSIAEKNYTISANQPGIQMTIDYIGEKPTLTVADESICKVSEDGYITPLKGGHTTITASTLNGTNTKTREVTVYRDLGDIEIAGEYDALDAYLGETTAFSKGIHVYASDEGGRQDITDDMDFYIDAKENGKIERMGSYQIIATPKNSIREYYDGDEYALKNKDGNDITKKGTSCTLTIDKKVPFQKYYEHAASKTSQSFGNKRLIGSDNLVLPYSEHGLDVDSKYGAAIYTYSSSADFTGTLSLDIDDYNVGTDKNAILSITGSDVIEDGSVNVKVNVTPKTTLNNDNGTTEGISIRAVFR